MADTFFNLNKQTNNASVNTPQPSGNPFNTNLTSLINKDNIFQQPSELLQKLGMPTNNEELKSKDLNTDTVNAQATQNLNNFLNSLGFKFNPTAMEPSDPSSKAQGPLELIARAKDGIYFIDEHEKGYLEDKSKIIYDNSTVAQFNKNGTLLAFASPNMLGVYVLEKKKALLFDLPNVIALDFSPGQKYLVTIDRRENKFYISIFEPDPLRKLYEFEAYRYKKETWPQVKFTDNDELAFWASRPTEIEVFNPRQNFRIINTIETRPFDFFKISGKMESLLLVCVGLEHSAGYDGHQGHIDIYRYHDMHHDKKPFVSKAIDKAHEVTLFFSPTGDNLLIWAQTFTDRTGQSYYGEHVLFYLDINKKELRTVPTYKGPIHDVAWNPNGLEFIAISGFMPAGSVLFDNLCTPKFEFGRHHRNTIKWSPLSRFVCLGGFGNLPGDMDIWDVYSLKLVGTCKSQAAVSCKWAPDGRRLITGVLNPRLRVSNNYKIFKYNGELLNCVDFSQSELYDVLWRPGGKFQDRPATPPKQSEKSENVDQASSVEKNDAPVEGKKMFRPKGAGTFAAQLKAQKNARPSGRFLSPDERFEEVVVGEEQGEKNAEGGEKEKKEEEPPKKPMSKILRRVDKKGEENGDNKNRENNLDGLDQKKENV